MYLMYHALAAVLNCKTVGTREQTGQHRTACVPFHLQYICTTCTVAASQWKGWGVDLNRGGWEERETIYLIYRFLDQCVQSLLTIRGQEGLWLLTGIFPSFSLHLRSDDIFLDFMTQMHR